MKYIYNSEGKYITTTFDYITNEEIESCYENCFITEIKYIVPIVKHKNLIETYNSKMTIIFNDDKEILEVKNGEFDNIEKSKVFDFNEDVLENTKYYFLNDNMDLVFNESLKLKDEEIEKSKKLEETKKEIEYNKKIDVLEQQIKDLTAMILDSFDLEGDE